jgi:hypothetical protein
MTKLDFHIEKYKNLYSVKKACFDVYLFIRNIKILSIHHANTHLLKVLITL